MSSTNKGRNPESFGDAFRQAARESLVKNQRERRSDIVSITPVQLVLAALAIGIYVLWNSWLCLIPLGVVLVLMWVRYTMRGRFPSISPIWMRRARPGAKPAISSI